LFCHVYGRAKGNAQFGGIQLTGLG
jgi:hypothetical protein